MQMLIYSFVWFIDQLRQLAGLVIPIFSEAADFRAGKLWVKVLVHCIIMAVILYGLYVLNRQPIVQQHLLQRVPNPVNTVFLPGLFALVYFLSWLMFVGRNHVSHGRHDSTTSLTEIVLK